MMLRRFLISSKLVINFSFQLPAFSFQLMKYFLCKKILEYVMMAPKIQPASTSLVQCTPSARRLQPIKAKMIPEIIIRFFLAFGYTSWSTYSMLVKNTAEAMAWPDGKLYEVSITKQNSGRIR